MINWLTDNLGTILVSSILLLTVAGIIVRMRFNKKNGNSSCGCGCANCAAHGQCHPTVQQGK